MSTATPSEEPHNEFTAISLRCPVLTCAGWVNDVDDFYGCGECGNVWFDRASLDAAITQAVDSKPYRAAVYVHTADGWQGVSLSEEPSDYRELVQAEWDEE